MNLKQENFSLFESLRNSLQSNNGSLFESLFGEFPDFPKYTSTVATPTKVTVTKNAAGEERFECNVAGFEKKEISISFDEAANILTVYAAPSKQNTLMSSSLTVTFKLLSDIKFEDISVEHKNGLLIFTIHESAEEPVSKVRKIKLD